MAVSNINSLILTKKITFFKIDSKLKIHINGENEIPRYKRSE